MSENRGLALPLLDIEMCKIALHGKHFDELARLSRNICSFLGEVRL